MTPGINPSDAASAISNVKPVAGRMEPVKGDHDFQVIVDYAHTDDALLKILEAANELTENRVISVFGCGGDRDKTKRPVMGQHAVNYSDIAILTSDNPRTEDPHQILADVVAGIKDVQIPRAELFIDVDRKSAIYKAVEIAQPGDMIAICGKGHEDYQIIGHTRRHFDDREVAREAIHNRV